MRPLKVWQLDYGQWTITIMEVPFLAHNTSVDSLVSSVGTQVMQPKMFKIISSKLREK